MSDERILLPVGRTDAIRHKAAIRAGVNNYVVKPFTPDLLSQRIRETLAKMQGAATPAARVRGPLAAPPPGVLGSRS